MARLFAVVVLSLIGTELSAAPFCSVTPYGKQCIYYTMGACYQAFSSKGNCTINEDEIAVPPPDADRPYCLVNASGFVHCYYTMDFCRRAALTWNGACVENRPER
jgi:hypothetical protein